MVTITLTSVFLLIWSVNEKKNDESSLNKINKINILLVLIIINTQYVKIFKVIEKNLKIIIRVTEVIWGVV